MTQIVAVRVSDYADSARELFAANWDETGFDFPFDLDVDRYQGLQDAGALFALAAIDDDKVVGYSTAVVAGHPFNSSVLMCSSDALFVHPEYRKGSVGARLIKATEDAARERGAVRMLWHTRAGTPLAEVLLARGYAEADVVVMKDISHGN